MDVGAEKEIKDAVDFPVTGIGEALKLVQMPLHTWNRVVSLPSPTVESTLR